MKGLSPPFLKAPPDIITAVNSICSMRGALNTLELLARKDSLKTLPLFDSPNWQAFADAARIAFAARDQLLIKGLPASNDGTTLLLAAVTVGSEFRTYRGGQIIKHFKMSPWTTELSHTTKDGEFHTDLNTEEKPPAITAMQCLEPDPGAPKFGVSRVARLMDLLDVLERHHSKEILDFLTKEPVTMLNDHSNSSWSGCIVEDKMIRYHPATLRAAAIRLKQPSSLLETQISKVADAAFAVSEPFCLERGDVLLLSNHRTLHYRGECSVIFKKYPTEFISRSVFVLHASEELKPK